MADKLIDDLKDEDQPSNTLEFFVELDEVVNMISRIKTATDPAFEKEYEVYSGILSRYQEQPHLLDAHLVNLIEILLLIIRNAGDGQQGIVHAGFKYLYQLAKVRAPKEFVKFLPHELSDLEFALKHLEEQNLADSDNWETRYMLLLWMSILVLNPFHLSRLDAFTPSTPSSEAITNDISTRITKMERIFTLCVVNCNSNDTCSSVASFLASKYLIRADVKDTYLPQFIEWVIEQSLSQVKIGQLAAIAAILKHGKREDLIPYAQILLKWTLESEYKNSSDFLKIKYFTKIVQRLGLVFLKPRLAHWRYQRGSRSLTANLSESTARDEKIQLQNSTLDQQGEADDEIYVPQEVEDVIEEMLQGLRLASSGVRWSSAKGIGRVTNRLPKAMGDEVIGSVIEILSPLEQHTAWHGACLAIAELAKRGLLLPYRLTTMVPLLQQALVYDEMKGYMSVGQHIRDAACYMSWAFARAYNPEDLQPFVHKIATGLLITTVFDREINCRRAASAAFQESVGRLGNFPYGIEILTVADFYSVGLRNNSFLQISDFIAQFVEYTVPLIDHLVDRKINHWDTTIRELSSKTLNKLTMHIPEYMATKVIPELFAKTEKVDVNTRHGAILAIGEIIFALRSIEREKDIPGVFVTFNTVNQINGLVDQLQKKQQFRGMSGEMMKHSCLDFIRNCSNAKVIVSDSCIDSWQFLIDACITHNSTQIREAAIDAMKSICEEYYSKGSCGKENEKIVHTYITGCANEQNETVRMGYVSVLGALPKFMILPCFESVITTLVQYATVPGIQVGADGEIISANSHTLTWSEARRDAIKSLSKVIDTIGFHEKSKYSFASSTYLNRVFECFLKGMEEYTLDDRGDIGAWVREASMAALNHLIKVCPRKLLLSIGNFIHLTMVGFAQQAVEKIDRTRGLAGKLFCDLVHFAPAIPNIKRHEELKEIFPEDSSKILWLFADHTFPLFCSMLALPEYSSRIILGLSASIGQLTESLIKYSSSSLFQYLKHHPTDVPRICEEILSVFQKNLLKERITSPFLNFLDIILSSGAINSVLLDNSHNFADNVFVLVNAEIKGHKKLYKLVSSINVFCQLLQVDRLCPKVLSKLTIFLGLTHVHIRKTTATKLYEALVIYGDTSGIADENMENVLEILSETDWGMPLAEIRPIRNNLCLLIGVKPPVTAAVAAASAKP